MRPITRPITLLALSLPAIALGNGHQALNQPVDNWGGGSDIMIDAFSNSIMGPASSTFETIPIENAVNEGTSSCIDSDAECATVSHYDKLTYEDITAPGFAYVRLIVTNTATTSDKKSHQLSYQYEMFLPAIQTKDDFLQGLAAKQIIRNQINSFLFQEKEFSQQEKKINRKTETSRINKAKTMQLSRLTLHFSDTDTASNFSDQNFTDLVTVFSKKRKKNHKKIQITQKTNIAEAAKTSTPQLLSQTQDEDKSGVNDITWLEPEETTEVQIDNNLLSDKDVVLSYQPIDNFDPEVNPKEADQNLPQQEDPFTWDPNATVEFNPRSPF